MQTNLRLYRDLDSEEGSAAMRCREFRVGGLFSRRWALALLLRADTAEEAAHEIGCAEQALRTWCGKRDRFGDKAVFSLVAPISLLPRMRDALEIMLNFGGVAKIVGALRIELECYDEWGERRDTESKRDVSSAKPLRESWSTREFHPSTASSARHTAPRRQERSTSVHERRRRALLRQAGAHSTPPG